MITREDLKSVGFISVNQWEYYDKVFDLMFNIKNQMLYQHSEVDGELDELTRPNNLEDLKNLIDIHNYV